MCGSLDQAAHYHTLHSKLGASSLTWHLAGLRVNDFWIIHSKIPWLLSGNKNISFRISRFQNSNSCSLNFFHTSEIWPLKIFTYMGHQKREKYRHYKSRPIEIRTRYPNHSLRSVAMRPLWSAQTIFLITNFSQINQLKESIGILKNIIYWVFTFTCVSKTCHWSLSKKNLKFLLCDDAREESNSACVGDAQMTRPPSTFYTPQNGTNTCIRAKLETRYKSILPLQEN
jgi:hypothetical protein